MSSSFLNKKIEKILTSTLEDDQETLEALKGLSSFFDDNSLSNRRNLRSTFEKRSLEINKEFLGSFNEINKIIDDLYQSANNLNEKCLKIKSDINDIKSKNNKIFEITNSVQKDLNVLELKKIALNKFLEKFQLTDEETDLLNTNKNQDIQVNDNFLKLFDKVKKIHNDAKIILIESNYQTTGIEIMDNMANNLEVLYEKLYKWSVKTIRNFRGNNLDATDNYLIKSLKLLEERPITFKLCLDEYDTIRRSIVSKTFIDKLIPASLKSLQNSNESFSFISEIMSWIHTTVINERNHLIGLLKECSKDLKNSDENKNDIIKNHLSFIVDSINDQVKIRVEKIIFKEANCVNLFNLRNLLMHYSSNLLQYLNKKSNLSQTITDLCHISHRIFINSLNYYCTFELTKNSNCYYEEILPSLSITPMLNKTILILKELISSQKKNYEFEEDNHKMIQTIMNIIFDPYINSINTTALKLNHLEKNIFSINCYNEMIEVLNKSEFTETFITQLNEKINESSSQIVYEFVSNSISICDLNTLYNTILKESNNPNRKPLSLQPGCFSLALQSCNKKIEIFINSNDNLFLTKLLLIKKSETKSIIKQKCLEEFCNIYNLIYTSLHDEFNEYDEPKTILSLEPSIVREKFNLQ